MFTWRKWWVLFTAIWALVAGLQVMTLLAFSEEPEKALQPLVLGVAVPAALYLIGLLWDRLRRKRNSGSGS